MVTLLYIATNGNLQKHHIMAGLVGDVALLLIISSFTGA